MGKGFLKQQQDMQQYYFETGDAVGFQRCLDYMQWLMKNPKYMGKDTFGRKRWKKIYKGLKECDQIFGDAFTHGVNADYCQEKLDANIREIFGNDALPFAERYPRFKTVSYKKPKKGWV